MDWTEGTALLISNRPIQLHGNFTDITDARLNNLIGGSGYTCTRLLQTYNVIYCTYLGGLCFGYYQVYLTRYGCEVAESGSCSTSRMLRYAECPCIVNPYNPFSCIGTGEWTFHFMRACA